jgi:hypothetical protein
MFGVGAGTRGAFSCDRPFTPALALLLALAGILQSCGTHTPVPPVVLSVGGTSFTAADIKVRESVIALKSSGAEEVTIGAYAQLIQGSLFTEVLAAMGHPITEEMLELEIRRIDRNTHDPDGLLNLKNACGGGQSPTYRKIGILPDFANRVFTQQVYPHIKEIHSGRLAEAYKVLEDLRRKESPKSGETPTTPPWERSVCLFSRETGFEPIRNAGDPPLPHPVSATPDPRWQTYERDYLGSTPMGVFCAKVIEMEDRFVLLRWTGWEDEERRIRKLEQLWLPKRAASEYFLEKAASIPVWVADPSVAKTLREKVSWSGGLSWRRP